jgi:hypothetical protein
MLFECLNGKQECVLLDLVWWILKHWFFLYFIIFNLVVILHV